MEYKKFRREYSAGGLHRKMLADSPLPQFELWLQQAVDAGLGDPTAMVLATVDGAGCPWQRIVLLKGVSERGFVFYTNYASDKATAMAGNSKVSLLFPWNALDRQVVIAGSTHKLSAAESASYFSSRPRESQIAAWASQQSRPIASRSELELSAEAVRQRFGEGEIPLPQFWGGYRVQAERIEFWQGGEHRLHDRFRYQIQPDGSWSIERLQP